MGAAAVRYLSLFSGIEAASVAWGPLGWEPVCFAELDEFPSALLAEAVGLDGYEGEHFEGGLLYCLEDLIDRPTTTRHGKFRTKYGRETPCCEVCGYSIGDMRWGYCPKCGAEVVE